MTSPVVRLAPPTEPVEMPWRDAVRYLGFGKTEPDAATRDLLEQVWGELQPVLTRRACYVRVPVDFPEEDVTDLDGYRVESHSLAVNLRGCREAYLFAATIGVEADRRIARLGRISAARAMAADALASASAEAWCARVNALLPADGLYLRPRFSPGYGDVALSHQAFFLQRLDAARQIGLMLTAGGMLAPVKSVTAVVGLGPSPVRCGHTGCAVCEAADCPYRV